MYSFPLGFWSPDSLVGLFSSVSSIWVNLPGYSLQPSSSALVNDLHWRWFDSLYTFGEDLISRKLVGVDPVSPNRRDFVRVKRPPANDTCLTVVQMLTFVEISGFSVELTLSKKYRNPPVNTQSVTFVLVRWLSPHRDTLLCVMTISDLSAGCPPFEINHTMWTFATTQSEESTPQTIIDRHIDCYDGKMVRRGELIRRRSEKDTMFDLLEPETFTRFVNCTRVNLDRDVILETITLSF